MIGSTFLDTLKMVISVALNVTHYYNVPLLMNIFYSSNNYVYHLERGNHVNIVNFLLKRK